MEINTIYECDDELYSCFSGNVRYQRNNQEARHKAQHDAPTTMLHCVDGVHRGDVLGIYAWPPCCFSVYCPPIQSLMVLLPNPD